MTFKPGDLKRRRRIEAHRSPRSGLNGPTRQRFFCLSSAAAPRLQTLPPISLGKPTCRFVDEAGPTSPDRRFPGNDDDAGQLGHGVGTASRGRSPRGNQVAAVIVGTAARPCSLFAKQIPRRTITSPMCTPMRKLMRQSGARLVLASAKAVCAALHRLHSASELRKNMIARRVRNAAPMVPNELVEDCAPFGQPLEACGPRQHPPGGCSPRHLLLRLRRGVGRLP